MACVVYPSTKRLLPCFVTSQETNSEPTVNADYRTRRRPFTRHAARAAGVQEVCGVRVEDKARAVTSVATVRVTRLRQNLCGYEIP